ncbi:helix-turn-helix transcriptional regulator [Actinoplanes sp. NPDC051513]|uniref:helix-turn-helix transcriptional regulator n=1 Tax=Actinoplanes sp. NPDC051513 TaxID=3363908 RepID=UPI003797F24C
MTRPTARVLALLEILQGGGVHSANELAERLGVDERTVRRYVEHLLDLEVPVEPVRGRYGGYRLAPGFRMPPLMLTDEEALAVLLGLTKTTQEAAESAAAKVRRVLPKRLAARLGTLLETARPPRGVAEPEAATMLRLAEATRQRRPAVIGYVDRKGQRTERTVHPYGLVAQEGRWYVTGAAEGGMRTFRLDRIEHVRLAEGTFAVPEGFVPEEAVRRDVPWRHRVTVRVRGAADDVQARLPRGVATVEPDGVEWVRVRLRAERLDWLPGVLAGLGIPFLVEEPAELRELVRDWVARLAVWVEQGESGLRDRAES